VPRPVTGRPLPLAVARWPPPENPGGVILMPTSAWRNRQPPKRYRARSLPFPRYLRRTFGIPGLPSDAAAPKWKHHRDRPCLEPSCARTVHPESSPPSVASANGPADEDPKRFPASGLLRPGSWREPRPRPDPADLRPSRSGRCASCRRLTGTRTAC